jgi:hypothetical protein
LRLGFKPVGLPSSAVDVLCVSSGFLEGVIDMAERD